MRSKIIITILAFSNAIYSQVPPVCFKPSVNYTINTGPSGVTIEDFNNDGFKDVATANTTTGNTSILFGSATGTLSFQANYSTGSNPRSVIASDFNGDSFKDLAVANSGANNVSILLGSGAGSFSASVNYTVGTTPYDVVSRDFNNDGHFDLAFCNAGSNNISVMFGSGTGTFGAPVFYAVGTYPVAIETADFNNDGKLDIVVANTNSNNISVLFGSNTGTFSIANTYTVGTNPSSVKTSDFNGDGFKDLVVVNYNSNNMSILLGSATGAFTFSSNYSVGLSPRSATIADFNGDSKMDIAVSVFSGNNVGVFLGNGNGTFASLLSFSSGSAPWGIGSGDINSDGKIDIVSANSGVQGGTGQVFSDIGVLINTLSPVISVSNGAVCPTKSFTITPSGATTYTYSSGSPVVSPSATTSYTVRGTLAGCVSAPAVCTVTISPKPTISMNSGTLCAGSTFTLKPLGASTYTITGGTALVSPTVTTSYSVVGTSSLGCISSNTAVSTITVAPSPNMSVTSGTICVGSGFTMVPSGALTYTYSSGSAIVTPTTTTSYTVIGRGANTCTNSIVSLVTVNQLPIIIVNSGTICSGAAFTMTPAGGNTYTYSTGSSTVIPFSNASYTVNGTDVNGCVNSAISSVTVNTIATITPIIGNATNCVGISNVYSITPVADAINYNWILPSELSGTVANTNLVSVLPSSASLAVSVLSVNVTNACGVSNTQTLSIYISTPSSQFISAQNTVCANSSATISATDDNTNILNYTWSTATQTICSSMNCNTITDSPSTTTTYSLTVTDVYNCSQTYAYTMNIIPTPTVLATSNSSLICTGNSATLTATGADTYSWSSGSNTNTEVVSPSSTSDYTVTGTGANGCSSNAIVTQSVSLCTAIEVYANNNQIVVYPNPSIGVLNIDLEYANSPTTINIYNTLGELVLSETLVSLKNQIKINELSNGIYVIKIIEDNRVITSMKIVKE